MLKHVPINRFVSFSTVLLSVSCSMLLDVDDKQCQVDADCTRKGLAGLCEGNVCVDVIAPEDEADTSCTSDADCRGATPRCLLSTHVCVSVSLGQQFVCFLPPPATTETVHYQFRVRLFVDHDKAPENLVTKACETADVACNAPIAVFTDTTGDGVVEFDLPKGRPVYFEVTSSGITVLSYRSNLPEVDNPKIRDIWVPVMADIDSLSAALNLQLDPLKGVVTLEVEDCTDRPATGVHFKHNPESGHSYYLQNSLPFPNGTVTSYDEVSNVAYGGFINVIPGIVELSAYWGVDGPLLNSLTAQVRPSTVTVVEMATRTR